MNQSSGGTPKIYISTRKFKRKAKLLVLQSDIRKKEVCSKSVSKALYGNKFLVSENILK